VCFFGGPRPAHGEQLQSLIARLEPEPPALLSVCNQILADPARTTESTLAQLDSLIDTLHDESDPTQIVRIGSAAILVDRLAGCREALWQVVFDGRRGGAVTSAIRALALLSSDDFLTGQWGEAEKLAHEGLELCDAHGYPLLARSLLHTMALLAAGRGDEVRTRKLSDDMTRWATPRHAGAVQVYADHARTLAALARSDFEDAYHRVIAISPPGEFPAHVPHALWVSVDLVAAAVHSGHRVEATAHVAAMRELKLSALSPRLALLEAGAAALVAPAHEAAEIFETAVTSPGCERWPFDLGRVQLAYGEHLRRSRATTESRRLFTQAFENFERLGARPWAARAAQELRATGHASIRADDFAVPPLTPQEQEIAMLAATGLTNKQIGKQLYLSHRTVGAHLYRVFPKLGITTRAALRDALATPAPTHA
jgi:DNA-binding CsgD family transcriptional regulator